jgi:DNA-binding transcriptional LysR family regulator
VRLGEAIAKDMIAVRIGPDVRMIVVGAPSYFAAHGKPNVPQDLAKHTCINLRLQTSQSFYAWEFQKGRRQLRVRVEGQLAFNDVPLIVEAAAAGFGLAFVMEDHARPLIGGGKLVEVLSDWTPPFAGYYLYYPSRRQPMAAFSSFVEALRYKA